MRGAGWADARTRGWVTGRGRFACGLWGRVPCRSRWACGGASRSRARGARALRAFVDGLRYFTLAESLGGVESLIAHPATMTHAAMTPEARAKAGISDGLLRLSIGIEAGEDLLADLTLALARAEAAASACKRALADA